MTVKLSFLGCCFQSIFSSKQFVTSVFGSHLSFYLEFSDMAISSSSSSSSPALSTYNPDPLLSHLPIFASGRSSGLRLVSAKGYSM